MSVLVIPCLSSLQIRRSISKNKSTTIQKTYETDAISVNLHNQDIKLIQKKTFFQSLSICCTNSAYQVVSQRGLTRLYRLRVCHRDPYRKVFSFQTIQNVKFMLHGKITQNPKMLQETLPASCLSKVRNRPVKNLVYENMNV